MSSKQTEAEKKKEAAILAAGVLDVKTRAATTKRTEATEAKTEATKKRAEAKTKRTEATAAKTEATKKRAEAKTKREDANLQQHSSIKKQEDAKMQQEKATELDKGVKHMEGKDFYKTLFDDVSKMKSPDRSSIETEIILKRNLKNKDTPFFEKEKQNPRFTPEHIANLKENRLFVYLDISGDILKKNEKIQPKVSEGGMNDYNKQKAKVQEQVNKEKSYNGGSRRQVGGDINDDQWEKRKQVIDNVSRRISIYKESGTKSAYLTELKALRIL